MSSERRARVFELIDAANAADPVKVTTAEGERPAELVYGERMSDMLERFHPGAGDHLAIAARGQHIERWTSPRASYPQGASAISSGATTSRPITPGASAP